MPDAARQGDDAVVGEHVAVEGIERRVVDVRGEDALLEVVEHDDAYRAAQAAKRPLVQLGPDLGAGAENQQPDGLARVAQGQDEEPCPPVLAGVGVTDHRSFAVVDLSFLPSIGGDHRPSRNRRLLPDGRDEAPHARIARREAVVVDQVLPDGRGVAPAAERVDDQLAVGLARARLWRSTGLLRGDGCGGRGALAGRRSRRRVGGHLLRNGRICWASRRPATAAHGQTGRLQVAAGGLTPDPGGLFDPPQRPAEASERENLLPFLFLQDVAHAGAGTSCSRPASTSRATIGNGRFSAAHQWPVLDAHRGGTWRRSALSARFRAPWRARGTCGGCSGSSRTGLVVCGSSRNPAVRP